MAPGLYCAPHFASRVPVPTAINATDALARLREGNQRFVNDMAASRSTGKDHLVDLAQGQSPFAIVLGCSDSRVPLEIVFDQGLGDLFVIRVAGNIVAPSIVGSVEFAASQCGTRLVVVLGHTGCGAVQATVDSVLDGQGAPTDSLQFIVNRVRPSVEPLAETELRNDRSALVDASVRANIRASASQLRGGSPLLERLIRDDGLVVVGGEYDLETGQVDFFDGV